MKWAPEAEQAIQKVPFFIRKRVRARVEQEAKDAGKSIISISEVKSTQKRFLNRMASEVRGFQVDTCFGNSGCENRVLNSEKLQKDIEDLLQKKNLKDFLKDRVKGEIKFHHEFRVTLADCPNACSQPQIKDVGIIGAAAPMIKSLQCSHCRQCIDACQENAVTITDDKLQPLIDFNRCVRCGHCISACPTGTLDTAATGYRILLGGKLGRHPRLAKELPGLFNADEVVEILKRCLMFYKRCNLSGERFGEMLEKHPSSINEILKTGEKS